MRHRWVVILAVVSAVATGCGGGGGEDDRVASPSVTDPLDQVTTTGERAVHVIGAGNVRLSGTLATPPAAGGGTVAGVLIVPSLAPGDRDGLIAPSGGSDRIGQDLAKAFSEAGIASLRYDRRGTGESKLAPEVRLSFDDLVADARAGIDFLAQRKETSGGELAVLGYDQGGLIALRLAATEPRVKRVVLVSTAGRPLVEVQAGELAAQYGHESADAFRSAVTGLLTTGTLPPLGSLRSELRPLLPAQEAAFLAQLYAIDPVAEAASVSVPTLAVVGTASPGVSRIDAERLASALGPRGETRVVENVGATLQAISPPTGSDRSEPGSPLHDHGAGPPQPVINRDGAALEQISGWLRAGPGRPPA